MAPKDNFPKFAGGEREASQEFVDAVNMAGELKRIAKNLSEREKQTLRIALEGLEEMLK